MICLVSLTTLVVTYFVPSKYLSVTVLVTIFSLSKRLLLWWVTVLTTCPGVWVTLLTTCPGVWVTVLTTCPGVWRTLTPYLYSTSAGIVDKTFLTF